MADHTAQRRVQERLAHYGISELAPNSTGHLGITMEA